MCLAKNTARNFTKSPTGACTLLSCCDSVVTMAPKKPPTKGMSRMTATFKKNNTADVNVKALHE